MPKVNIEQAHNVPATDAKKRLDTLSQDLSDKYGLTVKWLTDTEAKIERTGVTGIIKIEAQRVLLNLDLSFALTPLKGKIETRIRDELKKLFT